MGMGEAGTWRMEWGELSLGKQQREREHGKGRPGSACSPGLDPLPSSPPGQLSQCPAASHTPVQAVWAGSVAPGQLLTGHTGKFSNNLGLRNT